MLDPANPDIIYCALWEARQGPWENGQFSGPGSGLFKSTDGGATWKKLTEGLPTFEQDGLGRIGITVAPSLPSRMFATVNSARGDGLYRSDDAGEHWYRATTDTRVATRESDFAEVKVDPKNPDVVYTASVVTWKSIDGGKTFNAFRGAPGGDDYHRIWINPIDPRTMIIASDQGAIVTVNGGMTWSSWLNQPTAAFYHVAADYAFPYQACAAASRNPARRASTAAATTGVFSIGIGIPRASRSTATRRPIRSIRTSCSAARSRATIVAPGRSNRSVRTPAAGRRTGFRSLRTAPLVFSTVDPQRAVLRRERRLENAQRRKELDADQP